MHGRGYKLSGSTNICVPAALLGQLWVIDPARVTSDRELPAGTRYADRAADVQRIHFYGEADRLSRRAQLLSRLAVNRDRLAARELLDLERLPPAATVVANSPPQRGDWRLASDVSVHVGAVHPRRRATSGAPLPVVDLGLAVYRAQAVHRVIRAGGRVAGSSWDTLGAWRFVIEAPAEVHPRDIHPGLRRLYRSANAELITTTRVFLERGGDAASAAAELQVHRTTLYYRLQRIEAITGIDIKDTNDGFDLLMALRLMAYRRVPEDEAD